MLHPNAHDMGIHIELRTQPEYIDHPIVLSVPMCDLCICDSGTIWLQFGARNSQYRGSLEFLLIENRLLTYESYRKASDDNRSPPDQSANHF